MTWKDNRIWAALVFHSFLVDWPGREAGPASRLSDTGVIGVALPSLLSRHHFRYWTPLTQLIVGSTDPIDTAGCILYRPY